MKMLIDRDNDCVPDPSLLRVIACAHDIQSRLAHNSEFSVRDIAREERVTAACVYAVTPSLAGARHRNSARQRAAASATQRQEIDASNGTAVE
jgi:hypothetical protein